MERPIDPSPVGARRLEPPGEMVAGGTPALAEGPAEGPGEASLGELFSRMTEDVSTLVSKELQLAKVEIKEEVTKAAKGAGMLGGAGTTALYALLLLSFAAAWGLAVVIPTGFAFLVMGLLYLLLTGGLFLTGRKELKSVQPKPERTVQTLEEDVQWTKQQMS